MAKKIQLEQSWLNKLEEEFEKEYFINLKNFLISEKANYKVYPEGSKIFEAFNQTPLDKVKVVILGQDPYHGHGQAHGLCFSVRDGVKPPPSLVNIFKELKPDVNFDIPKSGNLTKWAQQGVFLLNATLTVRANTAGSHQNKGWETFTDKVISLISREKENIVFLLWGRYAQNKEVLIDNDKHLILKAAHPSPFSAYNGFFGCKHFSKANKYLTESSRSPVNWDLLS